MRLGIDWSFVSVQGEYAPLRGQRDALNTLDELLALEAIADEIRDGGHFQVMFLAEDFELGAAHHRAVVGKDFTTHARRFETSRDAQIDNCFSMPSTNENAAVLGANGNNVTGAGEVFGLGMIVDKDSNGCRAVVCTDASSGAMKRINGLAHGGAMAGGVDASHHFDFQIGEAFARRSNKGHPPAKLDHEIDRFRRAALAGDEKITFVFAVFIIDQHDEFAGTHVVEDFRDGGEGHSVFIIEGKNAKARRPEEMPRRKRKISGFFVVFLAPSRFRVLIKSVRNNEAIMQHMDAKFLQSQFEQALNYSAYLQTGTDEQKRRWAQVYDAAHLLPLQLTLLSGFARQMNVLVISGIWCGDCVQQCPLIERIAEGVPEKIALRYVDRDQHTELSSTLRINGGDRVPVVLFMAEDFELCGIYGERTLSRYRAIARRQLGASCPTGIGAPDQDEMAATLGDWLNEFERMQLLLRISPRLRQKYED
jgi:hypothetical protein